MISGDIDAVKILILNDANVNAATEYGNTPLHFSISKGIQFLYQSKNFVSFLNYNFTFRLIVFIFTNSVVTEFLTENGADVNATNIYGNTPLHEAAKLGNFQAEML